MIRTSSKSLVLVSHKILPDLEHFLHSVILLRNHMTHAGNCIKLYLYEQYVHVSSVIWCKTFYFINEKTCVKIKGMRTFHIRVFKYKKCFLEPWQLNVEQWIIKLYCKFFLGFLAIQMCLFFITEPCTKEKAEYYYCSWRSYWLSQQTYNIREG